MTRQEAQDAGQIDRWGDLWCTLMHTSPMWPIHGHYECGTCGRRHPVPWAEESKSIKSGASDAIH